MQHNCIFLLSYPVNHLTFIFWPRGEVGNFCFWMLVPVSTHQWLFTSALVTQLWLFEILGHPWRCSVGHREMGCGGRLAPLECQTYSMWIMLSKFKNTKKCDIVMHPTITATENYYEYKKWQRMSNVKSICMRLACHLVCISQVFPLSLAFGVIGQMFKSTGKRARQ